MERKFSRYIIENLSYFLDHIDKIIINWTLHFIEKDTIFNVKIRYQDQKKVILNIKEVYIIDIVVFLIINFM